MPYDPDTLYALLPAIHRVRDAAQGGVLREWIGIVAEQIAALEEDIDQLYDNAFIETCAEWAVPYLGDLIGYQPLHGAGNLRPSSRAEVANTIGFRRSKGTAAALEDLASDVTGWDTAVVEYFLRIATLQYLNHLRPDHAGTVDLRSMEPLERLGSPFDRVPRNVDVRRIAGGCGTHNIPNVGIHVFRLAASPWSGLRARPATPGDARRFLFHPLGIDTPLFTRAESETSLAHLAEPRNVSLRLTRRELRRRTSLHYGPGGSFFLVRVLPPAPGSTTPILEAIPTSEIESCDLADLGPDPNTSAWPDGHPTRVSVDPQLGRIRFPSDESEILVVFHRGLAARLGGGEYGRLDTFAAAPVNRTEFPGSHPSLQDALNAVGGSGTVEITTPGPIAETPTIACAAETQLEVRAADGVFPVVQLAGDLIVMGAPGSEVTLNGLLVAGGRVVVPASSGGQTNRLQKLRIVHCTFVPGLSLGRDGAPRFPDSPSLVIECPDTTVEIQYSICGALRAVPTASVRIENSIVDATSPERIAYAAPEPDSDDAGAPLRVDGCTIVGRVHTTTLSKASNTLFHADPRQLGGWPAAIIASRRQEGCVRFCYVPPGAIVPRRFRCVPARAEDAPALVPTFRSLRFGDPDYARFALPCPPALWRGADDEAELGVFHHLRQPHRESDLATRLDEYLRFGLEAGLFHAT